MAAALPLPRLRLRHSAMLIINFLGSIVVGHERFRLPRPRLHCLHSALLLPLPSQCRRFSVSLLLHLRLPRLRFAALLWLNPIAGPRPDRNAPA